MNPNNCNACIYKQDRDGGWCYMFRDEPNAVCAKHTARSGPSLEELVRVFGNWPADVPEVSGKVAG
jgi:hypothetical protein